MVNLCHIARRPAEERLKVIHHEPPHGFAGCGVRDGMEQPPGDRHVTKRRTAEVVGSGGGNERRGNGAEGLGGGSARFADDRRALSADGAEMLLVGSVTLAPGCQKGR